MITHKTLPRTLMITGNDPTQEDAFISKCIHHFQHGIKLVQLRANALSEKEYHTLAQRVIVAAKHHEVQVILNCDLSWINDLEADGVHLSSHDLIQTKYRPIPNHLLLSASCHNKEQLRHAQAIGADLVTLSPVQPTLTHPEAKPLGWDAFTALCQTVTLPIYALGGLSMAELEKARTLGAYGIAAIRSLWDKVP